MHGNVSLYIHAVVSFCCLSGVETGESSDGMFTELSIGIAIAAVGLLLMAVVAAVVFCVRKRLRTASGDARA